MAQTIHDQEEYLFAQALHILQVLQNRRERERRHGFNTQDAARLTEWLKRVVEEVTERDTPESTNHCRMS